MPTSKFSRRALELLVGRMSALGHKQTCALQNGMSALRSIATAKADTPQTVMSALPPKANIQMHNLLAAAQLPEAVSSGISNVKFEPTADTGRVNSAPNCFASALTSREPSLLLVVGSNPAGNPMPSSRTDTKTTS